jgi:hypothetical protein
MFIAVSGASLSVCRADTGVQLITQIPVGSTGITRLGYAPGRPNDLFAARLDGTIMRIDLTTGTASTYATIPNVTSSLNGQYGMMGFTFAPDFATSGNFYTYDAEDLNPAAGINHRNYVRKFTVDPTSNSPTIGTGSVIWRDDHPLTDHDGGFVGFQPGDPNDLWITEGDGGNMDSNPDPFRNGQNTNVDLGKILRVDITGDDFPGDPNRNYKIPANNPFANGVGGLPEIWDYGVRSPYSASFDRATGDFILGDVGQVTREEVDFERAGSAGGRNYGWRTMEGTIYGPFTHDANELPANDPSFTPPIYDYQHSGGYGTGDAVQFGGRSVTGGYVYHGSVGALQGKYVFGDWSSRQIWAMNIDRNANGGKGAVVPGSLIDLTSAFNVPLGGLGTFSSGVTAFGEDQAGELYYSQLDGHLYKIADVAPPPPPPIFALKPAATYRDDFNSSFNYATGSVPAGGIWSGSYNATNFGSTTFNANTTNAGQLTIGIKPVGWEGGGADTGPMLFRQVDVGTLMDVRVKISQQTPGNWSDAGIIVRVPGPIDHSGGNDNFLQALSFRTSATSNQASFSNVINGVEGENDTTVASANDISFLRLVNEGNGKFEFFTSSDGTNWISRQVGVNPALASGNVEVGLWAGSYNGGISTGTTQFDWAQITLGVPAGDYNGDGIINAADYTVWRDSLGQSVTPYSGADGNGDGMVTSADYDIWKGNFGKTIPNVGSGSGTPVPEPSSPLMAVISFCGLYGLVRQRRPDRRGLTGLG